MPSWIDPNAWDATVRSGFVYVGLDDQLYIQEGALQRGGKRRMLSYDKKDCSWPGWSPDNEWIVFFHITPDGPAVSVTQVHGIEERQVASFDDKIPIFSLWSPDSKHMVLLLQGDTLEAWLYHIDRPGEGRLLERGAPLFFCWSDDGESILFHSVQDAQTALLIRHFIDPRIPSIPLSRRPGFFCTPLWSNQTIYYVESTADDSCLFAIEDDQKTLVHRSRGLFSMVLSPSRKLGAVLQGGKTLSLLNVEEKQLSDLCDVSMQSFFWGDDDQSLIFSQLDKPNGCMNWFRLDIASQELTKLESFWPTRAQVFSLHFFEQFIMRGVPTQGDLLYFSGYDASRNEKDYTPKPSIFSLNFKNGQRQLLAHGQFCALPNRCK
ncbi:MAG: hypothetical protein VX278_02125 [Myxococcota bacterium]|nr:hypothetical protein [Myxococcota bacterium]